MNQLPAALAPFAAWDQFIVWIAVPNPADPNKLDKFPVDWRTGEVHSAHDPAIWTNPAVAMEMAPGYDRGWGSGAGFVLTEQDPFFFLDIDKCWAGEQWSPLAQELCARLPGAAVEVSQSGRGLHLFGTLSRPIEHGTKNVALGLEFYTKKRFVALTGTHAKGSAALDCTEAAEALVAQFFAPSVALNEFEGWTTEPVEGYGGPEDDEDLIRKACSSGQRSAAAAFGGQADVTFNDLWTANADPLARKWPSETGKLYDGSSADQALANHLAYWTGKNCERMERLMRRSGLAREKWDGHKTYLTNTILQACRFVDKVASGKATPAPSVPPPPREDLENAAHGAGRAVRAPNREYMGPVEQLEHFAGCYFLADSARVYDLRRNAIMVKASFDVVYGGHLFVVDPLGQKTTDSAWDAFTKSRVNVPLIVDDLCFRPELQSGMVVREGHRALVNSYVPYDAPTTEGDVERLLWLLQTILPVERDRDILLHYMAAMVQHPGRKFQWWPVLIGAEGNGKSLLIQALMFTVGPHYTHTPNPAKLAKEGIKFNAWLQRKLFLAIEEFYCANRRDFLEEIKTLVTNETNPLEKKGVDETTTDNRANGLMASNHLDAVPITVDTRRYAIFYTAQQTAAEVLGAGLTNAYWGDMWDWFKGRGVYSHQGAMYGARVIAGFFKTYPLREELDPTRGLAARAPQTSSTKAAIKASLGTVEQEILDAIEEGQQGFAGGWVSSYYLDLLIDRVRAKVQRNKRRDLMRALGYDWHPALLPADGRVNDVVTPDGRKPKLYVHKDHLSALMLQTPADVARAYSVAQTRALSEPSAAAKAFA